MPHTDVFAAQGGLTHLPNTMSCAPITTPDSAAELACRQSAGTWRSKRPLPAQPEDRAPLKVSRPAAGSADSGPSRGAAPGAYRAPAPPPYAELQAQNQALQAQVPSSTITSHNNDISNDFCG